MKSALLFTRVYSQMYVSIMATNITASGNVYFLFTIWTVCNKQITNFDIRMYFTRRIWLLHLTNARNHSMHFELFFDSNNPMHVRRPYKIRWWAGFGLQAFSLTYCLFSSYFLTHRYWCHLQTWWFTDSDLICQSDHHKQKAAQSYFPTP